MRENRFKAVTLYWNRFGILVIDRYYSKLFIAAKWNIGENNFLINCARLSRYSGMILHFIVVLLSPPLVCSIKSIIKRNDKKNVYPE